MLVGQFAALRSFSERDTFAVNKIYGKQDKTEQEWEKILKTDFSFTIEKQEENKKTSSK